jgi:Mg2+/Co2+ transporter CorB
MVTFDPTAASVVLLVALLGLSAFFSSTEIAIFSLSPAWLTERATAGDARAGSLSAMREDPHRLLVTLLVGNNVVNVAISSILAVLLAGRVSGGLAVVITTLVASSVILVLGEILPKAYGLGNAETWALRTAGPLRVVERILWPLVVVFDLFTRRASGAIGGDPDIEGPYTGGEGAK